MAGVERPRNVTSVGALVVRRQSLLVVRMTYGPTRGRYMLPGGLLDPGETLDEAAIREVREETSVDALPIGIVGLRSRVNERGSTDTYIVWLLEHLSGEPVADDRENDDARFLDFDDILARDDIAELVRYFTARVQAGSIKPHRFVTDYDHQAGNVSPDSWKLFV